MTHQLPDLAEGAPHKERPRRLASRTVRARRPAMEAFKKDTKLSFEIARAHGRAQGLLRAAEMAREIYEAGHSPDVARGPPHAIHGRAFPQEAAPRGGIAAGACRGACWEANVAQLLADARFGEKQQKQRKNCFSTC